MVSVLFVCLGNICRSPAAEAVFKEIVAKQAGADASSFYIDSCGTGGGNTNWYNVGGSSYHEGDMADWRMTKEATKRGYSLTSRSRPLKQQDIDEFDYIICMDDTNKVAVLEAAEAWGGASCRDLASRKIAMMTHFCSTFQGNTHVPDPWYKGDFDHVLDLLEDACDGLYIHLCGQQQGLTKTGRQW